MSTLKQYLQNHGRPVGIYSERLSIFRPAAITEQARLTQFGRTLKALDIEAIQAMTPQTKCRVELVNRILQDSLIKELRLNGISTLATGNVLLPEFIKRFNARFAQPAPIAIDAHRDFVQNTIELGSMMSFQSQPIHRKNSDFDTRFKSINV